MIRLGRKRIVKIEIKRKGNSIGPEEAYNKSGSNCEIDADSLEDTVFEDNEKAIEAYQS